MRTIVLLATAGLIAGLGFLVALVVMRATPAEPTPEARMVEPRTSGW